MKSLSNLLAFSRSAEALNFSEAARRLGISASAVSKNVAQLEKSIGVKLFFRSTRHLTLTEAGEKLYADIGDHLDGIQAAVSRVDAARSIPSGTLRVSLPPLFGMHHILPLLSSFSQTYPHIIPDWHFENRQVDIIAEGFDAAIGGAIDLMPGVIARELCKLHLVAVASPAFMKNYASPAHPEQLANFKAIAVRSTQTGRIRSWTMQNSAGDKVDVKLTPSAIMNDPEALCICAASGLGVTLAPLDAAYPYLARGELVRLLPDWHVDVGSVSIYYSERKLLPAKTRVFVETIITHFHKHLAHKFSAVKA